MFGSKLAAAQERTSALAALVASLNLSGFDAAALANLETALPTAEALGAQIASGRQAAIDAATAPLNTQLAAARADAAALRAGLAAAGVRIADTFDAAALAAGPDGAPSAAVAAVKDAVTAAVTSAAARQVAAAGHPHALDIPASPSAASDSAADTDTAPATAADFLKAHAAIKDPAERTTYFRKHAHRFPVR
ncbi:hypothetical protein OpiT1DRAFT_00196 [Opitutaceae bacterium TAV1]|nr:hypothetical protein OpiT1DRAFT_00196 [Opitutaceae bacterium TAV1]